MSRRIPHFVQVKWVLRLQWFDMGTARCGRFFGCTKQQTQTQTHAHQTSDSARVRTEKNDLRHTQTRCQVFLCTRTKLIISSQSRLCTKHWGTKLNAPTSYRNLLNDERFHFSNEKKDMSSDGKREDEEAKTETINWVHVYAVMLNVSNASNFWNLCFFFSFGWFMEKKKAPTRKANNWGNMGK